MTWQRSQLGDVRRRCATTKRVASSVFRRNESVLNVRAASSLVVSIREPPSDVTCGIFSTAIPFPE